jgi:hypothetical protein
MDRRRFLLTALAGVLASPLAVGAHQAGKIPRVALLSTAGDPAVLGAFAAEMRGFGYVEGQNLITEIRTAGRPERFPDLVSELIRLNVDVIVAWSMLAVLAAKQATTTIPIVMGSSGMRWRLASFAACRVRAGMSRDCPRGAPSCRRSTSTFSEKLFRQLLASFF